MLLLVKKEFYNDAGLVLRPAPLVVAFCGICAGPAMEPVTAFFTGSRGIYPPFISVLGLLLRSRGSKTLLVDVRLLRVKGVRRMTFNYFTERCYE